MAKDEQVQEHGEVTTVAHGETITVPADAPMPDVEPGHKGHELNPGPVFDPNAARREQEGRGPGLQDSEIMAPAHWQQETPAAESLPALRAKLAALQHEQEGYKRSGDTKHAQGVNAEIARVEKAIAAAEGDDAGEQPAQD